MEPAQHSASPPSPLAPMLWAFDGMVKLLWTRACPAGTLYIDFGKRVRAIQARLVAIAAMVAAGTLPVPRAYLPRRSRNAGAARPVRPGRPGVATVFPSVYGWLAKMLQHELATFTMTFVYGIQTPEMQALMKAAPEVGDLFREIFFAGGVLGDAKPFLPPSAGQRYRQRRAAYRAAQSAAAADASPADQPPSDQPPSDQPAADQPAADQPAADQPAADQPAADPQAASPQPGAAPNPRRVRHRAVKRAHEADRTHEPIPAAATAQSSKA